MTAILIRVAVLAAAAVGVMGLVHLWSRRPLRVGTTFGPGLWVVTGPACSMCEQLAGRLRNRQVAARFVRYDDAVVRRLGVRSLPTVLVSGADGRILARRSGRLAVEHLDDLIDLAADRSSS